MTWQKIRVNKFERTLHPDDSVIGLPIPTALHKLPDYAREAWDEYHVQRNDSGEWVGRNGLVNQWLVDNEDNLLSTVVLTEELDIPDANGLVSGGILPNESILPIQEGGEYVVPNKDLLDILPKNAEPTEGEETEVPSTEAEPVRKKRKYTGKANKPV